MESRIAEVIQKLMKNATSVTTRQEAQTKQHFRRFMIVTPRSCPSANVTLTQSSDIFVSNEIENLQSLDLQTLTKAIEQEANTFLVQSEVDCCSHGQRSGVVTATSESHRRPSISWQRAFRRS